MDRTRPLRFLFCNYEYPPLGGGAGMVSKFLARELVARGHHVEVVTTWFPGLERRTVEGNLTITRLRSRRRKMGQSNPVEMISYVLTALPWVLLRLAKRPDVIMSYHSIPSGLVGFPLSILWRIPHIVQFHGGDVPGWLPGVLSTYHRCTLWLNRWVVYQAAAAVAVSDGLRDLAQPSFPKRQLGTLANGVDLEVFTPPPSGRAGRDGPPRLFFVGRVTVQKGVDVLLKALADPRVMALDWCLDLAGDGPQLAEYREQAAALGLTDRIVFHGWLTREQVRPLFDTADVLVLPSRYEGMPIVVLEAMGCGLPVIATDIPGTRELIADGETGLLVKPEDSADLAAALARLIGDPAERLRIGAQARTDAEARWSWAARAEELETLALDSMRRWGRS
ncbi:glycosyltransferase [bacterium]|nr:glycosyltransferase [bacterium]